MNVQSASRKTTKIVLICMFNLISFSCGIGAAEADEAKTRSLPSIDVVQKSYMPNPMVRASAQSIISLVNDMAPNLKEPFKVKVPTANFVGVLQELQNRNARFLFPGVDIPVNAKVVFQLEAEQAGLRQIVYFL